MANYCALLFVSVSARAETPAEHAMALVQSEDLQEIGAYLAQPGVGINDRPGDVKTLLDYAAEQNRVKVAQYLLDRGAEVNTLTQRAAVPSRLLQWPRGDGPVDRTWRGSQFGKGNSITPDLRGVPGEPQSS
jgi:ankyrin repeat protein